MTSSPQYTQQEANFALNYLAAVEDQFASNPEQYKQFLAYMTQYNKKQITALFLVERVSGILYKFPNLIDGFNHFLPPGWHMKSSPDEVTPNSWNIEIVNKEGTFLRRYSEVEASDDDEGDDASTRNEEFKEMVALVGSIKERYTDNPTVFKEFLRAIDPSSNSGSREQIFVTVKELLHESPDLIDRFKALVVGD